MDSAQISRAYRYCAWITARHYENFPVASRLLPARLRPQVAAVYAFARAADDFADEEKYSGRSLELLNRWRVALRACVIPPGGDPAAAPRSSLSQDKTRRMETRDLASAGSPPGRNPALAPLTSPSPNRTERKETFDVARAESPPGGGNHPIFIALGDTIRRHHLPVQLLDDLLTAFTMDVTKRRYADWGELLTYCRYSANPVGRLVLALFGIHDPVLERQSDCICTGLQLANHWQDLRIDMARGMLYIPQDLMRQFGVTEEELRSYLPGTGDAGDVPPAAARSSADPSFLFPSSRGRGLSEHGNGRHDPAAGPVPGEPFRALMKELVGRAHALFDEGEPLVRNLKGGLRLEIKLTVLGGRAILDRIEKSNYDVFYHRPVISTFDKLRLLTAAVFSR